MNSKKSVSLKYCTKKGSSRARMQTHAVIMVSTLKDTPLAKIKESVPENRAIQSLSSEEYDKYVKRLSRTNQLLAKLEA